MICYMCKQNTNVGETGTTRIWRLDCLHCPKINPNISVCLTHFVRQDSGRSTCEYIPILCKVYFTTPDDDKNTFSWTFDINERTTTFSRIEKDCDAPVVHVFKELMNIPIDKLHTKTKTILLFS